MKRSEFIKKVLKSKANAVFTTKEQVENSLEIFEKLGMLPPKIFTAYKDSDLVCTYKDMDKDLKRIIPAPSKVKHSQWESED